MGCCVSTQEDLHLPLESTIGNRTPPPPAEEETVKEVLSVADTPKPRPVVPRLKPQLPLRKIYEQKVGDDKNREKQSILHGKELGSPTATDKTAGVYESLSEDVSEVCSLSLSESVLTATINERQDEDEVRQRVFRSPARATTTRNRELVAKGERVAGRSPNRRSDQSPGKRNGFVRGGSVRAIKSREPGPRTAIRKTRPNVSESSGRWSRSPPVNRSVMGRSPSVGRVESVPGRARVERVGSGKVNKVEEENENLKNSAPNESLENPLVSLECFIFL